MKENQTFRQKVAELFTNGIEAIKWLFQSGAVQPVTEQEVADECQLPDSDIVFDSDATDSDYIRFDDKTPIETGTRVIICEDSRIENLDDLVFSYTVDDLKSFIGKHGFVVSNYTTTRADYPFVCTVKIDGLDVELGYYNSELSPEEVTLSLPFTRIPKKHIEYASTAGAGIFPTMTKKLSKKDKKIIEILELCMVPLTASEIGITYYQMKYGQKERHKKSSGSDYASRNLKALVNSGHIECKDGKYFIKSDVN